MARPLLEDRPTRKGGGSGSALFPCDPPGGKFTRRAPGVGPDVAELLPELTPAHMWDLIAEETARDVHAHPTLSEAVKEAVHGLTGHMINL